MGEGASPCQANLGVFHGRLLRRGVWAKGAGPSGRNKPAGFPLTFCFQWIMNGVSHWACEVVGSGSVNSKGVKWYWVYYPRREYK